MKMILFWISFLDLGRLLMPLCKLMLIIILIENLLWFNYRKYVEKILRMAPQGHGVDS